MTSQKDQIQVFINEIDEALQKTVSRLPWAASGQVAQQRQILQRVRSYLVMQQRIPANQTTSSEVNMQQVMQSVVQEMNELRSGLLRPLQSEVATLTQQRNALIREIRRLEAHRQSYQTERSTPPSAEQIPEQIQRVQDHADQALTTLDTTLKVVFESLQQDVNAYQDSLAQGLDKLHHLGQQGEVMVTTLVNRLAEQLGREASSYLHSQAPADLTDTQAPQTSLHPGTLVKSDSTASTPISLPYPGTEIPANPAQSPTAATDPFSLDAPPLETPYNTDETINALTDLLAQLSADASQPLNVVSISPPAIASSYPQGVDPATSSEPRSLAEATYTPEENLLPSQPASENPDLELTLDSTTLHQLSQDLSNLDKPGAASTAIPPIENSVETSTAAPSEDPSSKVESVFNLEGMDDLFVEDAPPESEP
ncbi:hypothetical protein [Phormidesmis priestleyi]